jgi:16S rRNA (guanine1207-N2)-methyltransferase
MESSTELILKNRERFTGKSLLVIGCPSVGSAHMLLSGLGATLSFLHRDYSVYSRFRDNSADESHHQFGVWWPDECPAVDAVLLHMPKGKELLEQTLSAIATLNTTDVYVVGVKRSGIESAHKVLKSRFGTCRKIDSARHSLLLLTRLAGGADSFSISEFQQRWPIELEDSTIQVVSLPGVFSHGRLDEGTRRLLDCFGGSTGGRVLDFGCGCGVIGTAIATLSPDTEVHMIDSDAMAVASAQATIDANNLSNARCYPSDLFGDVRDWFDLIISNPTFHQGNSTDQRMVTTLTADSGKYLKPEGRLVMVANRFLPYHSLLSKHFHRVQTLLRDSRYSVYQASHPKVTN